MRAKRTTAIRLLLLFAVAISITLFAAGAAYAGQWVTGDTHNHTHFSDGNQYLPTLVDQAFRVWKLDWLGSTDHGGEWDRDANGNKYTADTVGNGSGDIWAWDAMLDNWDSFNDLRGLYPGKVLFQGLEWGVPGVDESKTVIVDDYQQPYTDPSAAPTYDTGMAISDFEFLFDKLDTDIDQTPTLGGPAGTTYDRYPRATWEKTLNNYDKYARGLQAAKFLGMYFGSASYSILSHPSRDLLWTVGDIRTYNDAAGGTFFGMAGIPGSQKEPPSRGGYDEEWTNEDGTINWAITSQARTYGGADYLTAKLGGGWDSLLGEGRKFWIFSDSDFHNPAEEFWPGQYSKDHTWVDADTAAGDLPTPGDIISGLRSGNSFSVEAQLIDGLEFKAATKSGASATMGGTLRSVPKGTSLTVTVKWHSPAKNNNGDVPKVNHVDLISGNVTGPISSSSIEYWTRTTNPSTKVAARFFSASLRPSKTGWYSATYSVKATADMYFRLRGTNQGLNVPLQTDANGNPLMDDLEGINDDVKCWKDIWFYGNPIFVDVQ